MHPFQETVFVFHSVKIEEGYHKDGISHYFAIINSSLINQLLQGCLLRQSSDCSSRSQIFASRYQTHNFRKWCGILQTLLKGLWRKSCRYGKKERNFQRVGTFLRACRPLLLISQPTTFRQIYEEAGGLYRGSGGQYPASHCEGLCSVIGQSMFWFFVDKLAVWVFL